MSVVEAFGKYELTKGFVDLQGILPRARCYFESGMNVCLVGPLGIGKTTLVHELAGGGDVKFKLHLPIHEELENTARTTSGHTSGELQ